MLVTVDQLQKGDVVILCANGSLFEAKLLRQPKHSITKKPLTWRNTQKWCSIPCAVRQETITYNYGIAPNTRPYSQVRLVVADGQDYNQEKRINFTDRDCWLIKREEL
jgi:hypothetical protein